MKAFLLNLTCPSALLLLGLFLGCDGCNQPKDPSRNQDRDLPITDAMIERARKGKGGHTYHQWDFLAKKLADLKNNVASVDIDEKNATDNNLSALHYAAILGDIEIINLFLAKKADINVQAKNGYTPLHVAAYENVKESVALLLAAGADKELTINDGKTALKIAEKRNKNGSHDAIIAFLSQ